MHMNDQFEKENKISSEILHLRKNGKIDKAIEICTKAVSDFPQDNFYCKILGDLHFQCGNYREASEAYLLNLQRMKGSPKLFRAFQRFYQKLQRQVTEEFILEYKERIWSSLAQKKMSPEIEKCCWNFFGCALIADKKLLETLKKSDQPKKISEVRKVFHEWNKKKKTLEINALIVYRLENVAATNGNVIDIDLFNYLVQEKRYNEALAFVQRFNFYKNNKSVICSIFRVCRYIDDYSIAEKLFSIDTEVLPQNDFNIQYELVYYYQKNMDENALKNVLKRMSKMAKNSWPIARTLYNFYLNFDMFDEAEVLYEQMQHIKRKNLHINSQSEEQEESDHVVWQKLKNLVSEQEHNRQMIAMRDLLKGFAHELGQPITNIRYEVQLLEMRLNMGGISNQDISVAIENVLGQTARIGTLLSRFRPIVSQKSIQSNFGIIECIQNVFVDLNGRLQTQGVIYEICGDSALTLYGDQLQFSQVFYNLILNSLQAMNHKGKISVSVKKDRKQNIVIDFTDDGPGIPKQNQKKIFEPFFSTKDPTEGNGGEGLGLFIVWNILKMFNGIIYVDRYYTEGARFNIYITSSGENSR